MAHAEFLRQEGSNDLTAEFIQNDWRRADLSEAERAMLEWAEKLTLTPFAMTEKDIQKLRDVGWADRDILDIAHVSAYYNFRVRMVDGLGLQLRNVDIEFAQKRRERAAESASEKGVELPEYIWGVTTSDKKAAR